MPRRDDVSSEKRSREAEFVAAATQFSSRHASRTVRRRAPRRTTRRRPVRIRPGQCVPEEGLEPSRPCGQSTTLARAGSPHARRCSRPAARHPCRAWRVVTRPTHLCRAIYVKRAARLPFAHQGPRPRIRLGFPLASVAPGETTGHGPAALHEPQEVLIVRTTRQRLAFAVIAGGLVLGTAAPAFAGDTCGKPKCNSGRGNGSELVHRVDCDPGNSAGHNNGGD